MNTKDTPRSTPAQGPKATGPANNPANSPANSPAADRGGIPKDPREVRLPHAYAPGDTLPSFLWVLLPTGEWAKMGVTLRHALPLMTEDGLIPALDLDVRDVEAKLQEIALPLTEGNVAFPANAQELVDMAPDYRTHVIEELYKAEMTARAARRLAGEEMDEYAYLGADGWYHIESEDGTSIRQGGQWAVIDSDGTATLTGEPGRGFDDEDEELEAWQA